VHNFNASSPVLYKNYGFFLARAKQFDKAIEQFNIALRLSPNFAFAYSDRGNAPSLPSPSDVDGGWRVCPRSLRSLARTFGTRRARLLAHFKN
jgi:hypothetical protein